MIKINNGEVFINGECVTNKPIFNYLTVDGKMLLPTYQERRDSWIDVVDEENAVAEVYFHWELDCVCRYDKAKKRLRFLLDQEDYENWNQKDYGEFDF